MNAVTMAFAAGAMIFVAAGRIRGSGVAERSAGVMIILDVQFG